MSGISKSHLNTPLKRVRGLGSARAGVHHWWMQRVTSLIVAPLSMWFLATLINRLLSEDRGAVGAWLAEPFSAIALVTLLVALFLHSRLGLQVVIEDYMHGESKKFFALLLNGALNLIFGVMAVAAVAHMHFFGA